MNKIYIMFDCSVILRGNAEQVATALWKRCKRKHKSVQEYMTFRAKIEKSYSGHTLNTDSPESSIASLVECGFIIPLN